MESKSIRLLVFDEIIENCWKDPNYNEDKN